MLYNKHDTVTKKSNSNANVRSIIYSSSHRIDFKEKTIFHRSKIIAVVHVVDAL